MNKQNKGITLVALVITIIVLIILAGVSINAVMNDGLIGNAKAAKDDYKQATQDEQVELGKIQQVLESVEHGGWTQEEDEITKEIKTTQEDGTVTTEIKTVKVGDIANYTPAEKPEGYTVLAKDSGCDENQTITAAEDLTWKVIGITENGRVQIMPTTVPNQIKVKGKIGYENIDKIVSNLCTYLYSSENSDSIGNWLDRQTMNALVAEDLDDGKEFDIIYSAMSNGYVYYGVKDGNEQLGEFYDSFDFTWNYDEDGNTNFLEVWGVPGSTLWDDFDGYLQEREATTGFMPIVTLSSDFVDFESAE